MLKGKSPFFISSPTICILGTVILRRKELTCEETETLSFMLLNVNQMPKVINAHLTLLKLMYLQPIVYFQILYCGHCILNEYEQQ